jgi:hypothetical protein
MTKDQTTPEQYRDWAAELLDWLDNHPDDIPANDAVVIMSMATAALCRMLGHKHDKDPMVGARLASKMIMNMVKEWEAQEAAEVLKW